MKLNSILIIDDSEEDRYLLKRLVADTGLTDVVFETTNGADGLEFLETRAADGACADGDFPPALIFLDINMPILDGHGFLSAFHDLRDRVSELGSVVCLMLSSSMHPDDLTLASEYEFVRGYISKMPASGADLQATVARLIGRDQPAASSA